MEIDIKKLQKSYIEYNNKEVEVSGWIRNNRAQKEFGFIDLNDGTDFLSIQVVYEQEALDNFKEVSKFRVGS
ncbi:MAG: OB-fold nucleic acid binding domain-containing protein, partial [Candidatus Izemoplasmatales bacterium]